MLISLVGGSGFLGQALVYELSRAGHSCRVLTRHPERRRELALVPGVQLVAGNVHDPAVLRRAFAGADAVLSMAGILNEPGSGGAGFRKVHVDLVAGIIEACRTAGVRRVLHVSAINAGRGRSHYLQSKGEAERLLLGSGLDVSLFRPSVIFGPGDSFFNRFAGLLRLTPVLPLACAGSRLQPVFVGDVALAMRRALDQPDTIGQVLELVGPRVYTLGELVRWTAVQLGLRRWVPGLPAPLSRLQAGIMDWVPGKPFSSDNWHSLQLDNVSDANAWPQFGIQPRSVEATVPDYLLQSPRQQRMQRARGSRRAT